jgi:hypothetical protein
LRGASEVDGAVLANGDGVTAVHAGLTHIRWSRSQPVAWSGA